MISFSDYYPFGSIMPGRGNNPDNYRYGFGGHEEENNLKGAGNHISFCDFGFDPRIARRWSPDPKMKEFPSWNPYFYAFNSPIIFSDKDGEKPIIVIDEQTKTIFIFQPVFVVTKGPGAVPLNKIEKLQREFDQNVVTSHLHAISKQTGDKYNIIISFQFFEGGTIEEAREKNNEGSRLLGLRFRGIFASYDDDDEYENVYIKMGGSKLKALSSGGFTYSNSEIRVRGSRATKRERIHEGFHLLYAQDKTDAVGIMKYTDQYGVGPMVTIPNIEEVLNRILIKNSPYLVIFNENGQMEMGSFSDYGEFLIKEKPDPSDGWAGSGMGRMHLENLKNPSPNFFKTEEE